MWPGCAAWLEPAAAEHGPRCLAAFAARWRKSEGRAGTRGSGAAARAAASAAAGSARRAPHSRLPHLAHPAGRAARRGCSSARLRKLSQAPCSARRRRPGARRAHRVCSSAWSRNSVRCARRPSSLPTRKRSRQSRNRCGNAMPARRTRRAPAASRPARTRARPTLTLNLIRQGPAALRPGQTRGARQPVKVTRLR